MTKAAKKQGRAFMEWLKDRFGERVRLNEPMSRHTTLKVGGPADALLTVESLDELSLVLREAGLAGIPWQVMGGGSNLLVTDKGVRGLVIRLGRGFTAISAEEGAFDEVAVSAGAGVSLAGLVRYAAMQGFKGLNFGAGIPGTLGGAVAGNAGTDAGAMGDVVKRLALVSVSGETVVAEKEDLHWAYREMDMEGVEDGSRLSGVITEVLLSLKKGDPATLEMERRERIAKRAQTQPTGVFSAGCFFRNPPEGPPAGLLIDQAGLKGLRMGGAAVSEVHANYLVNAGGATAADFLGLMESIRKTVEEKDGVTLVPEVRILGE